MVMRRVCLLVLLVFVSCGSGGGGGLIDAGDVDSLDAWNEGEAPPGECSVEGSKMCFGGIYYVCQGGGWAELEDCQRQGLDCYDDYGCVMCVPDSRFCEGQILKQCAADGRDAQEIADCSELSGAICDTVTGACISLCEEAERNRSNVGCEYWAVDLDNAENAFDLAAAGQFAVAVANINAVYTATVTVTMNEGGYGMPLAEVTVETTAIEPGQLYVFNLPRRDIDGPNVEDHKDDGPQSGLSSRAFKITSTVPVVAYQFNPIDQMYSNDASLLIPRSGIDNLYYVITAPPANPMVIGGIIDKPNRCYVTVVGVEEDTHVSVTPTYDIEASIEPIPAGYQAIPAIMAGETYETVVGPYDVLNLETRAMLSMRDDIPDLTGTVVEADKPVVVFSGVDLTVFGDETPPGCVDPSECNCCAEHVEQQVIPKTSMGRKFVVTRSPIRSTGGYVEPDYYTVMAAKDDTVVTTNLSELPTFTLNRLEARNFKSTTGFVLEASRPVHVVQFLTSQQQCTRVIGDPSMIPFPAVEERRTYYVFNTGVGFEESYAVISIAQGFDATIDGQDISSVCDGPVATGELDGRVYLQYTCRISEGVHTVDGGSQPVGVIVYGYYTAGSYGYPAGSDLRKIFLE